MNRKVITFILLSLLAVNCYGQIAVYCPKCKRHLYDYTKDAEELKKTPVNAADFVPTSPDIEQPTEDDPMECPFDHAPLNGWEYWAWELHRHNHLVYPALSVLTKDDNGKWVWTPYPIDWPEMDKLVGIER